MQNYSKLIDVKEPNDQYMQMNDNQNDKFESYVDMSAKNDTINQTNRCIKVQYMNENVVFENSYGYDQIKSVRSIYVNNPVYNEPMEAVPMIQL